jgi:hypothetical protein
MPCTNTCTASPIIKGAADATKSGTSRAGCLHGARTPTHWPKRSAGQSSTSAIDESTLKACRNANLAAEAYGEPSEISTNKLPDRVCRFCA